VRRRHPFRLRRYRVALAAAVFGTVVFARAEDRAAWMREARTGVMIHYLAEWIARGENTQKEMTVEEWNRLVDRFDVEGLAKQLDSVGAGYVILTLGQNSGFYLSPNATYDRLVANGPSKCARRDLVANLSEALRSRGIRLIVYLPSGAPARDSAAVKALEWKDGEHRNREFQRKWERVIREWSERWGTRVAGWWFDGCYWPNTMYRSAEPPNFESFASAARAGNPASAIAFNPGVVGRILSITPCEDYTAGEINSPDSFMIQSVVAGKVDGAQVHALSYLGATWGKGSPRFSDEQVILWTRKVARSGGGVTWDVPVGPDGLIQTPFLEQLAGIGRALGRK
jgi:Alpha-L-fucosidase